MSSSFNFTPEQQDKFSNIYYQTKQLYPHLVENKVMKEKTKVLIAYAVINGDLPSNEIKDEAKETEMIELKD